jgi:hypothetical protein
MHISCTAEESEPKPVLEMKGEKEEGDRCGRLNSRDSNIVE